MGKLATAILSKENGQLQLQCTTEGSGTALSVEAMDQLIDALGLFRASQQPSVRAADPVVGETVQAIFDLRWFIGGEPLTNGALLQIRHPGFGWRLPSDFWLG